MFYIWITMQCYFAFLSIDMFVFFTRYSLRYLSLKLSLTYFIHEIVVTDCTKYMAFAFAQKLSARTSKADKGHRSLSEAI